MYSWNGPKTYKKQICSRASLPFISCQANKLGSSWDIFSYFAYCLFHPHVVGISQDMAPLHYLVIQGFTKPPPPSLTFCSLFRLMSSTDSCSLCDCSDDVWNVMCTSERIHLPLPPTSCSFLPNFPKLEYHWSTHDLVTTSLNRMASPFFLPPSLPSIFVTTKFLSFFQTPTNKLLEEF